MLVFNGEVALDPEEEEEEELNNKIQEISAV